MAEHRLVRVRCGVRCEAVPPVSNLPPERLTARHLNPDFVPRARYDQLVAEHQQQAVDVADLTVKLAAARAARDALLAENQQLRDALEAVSALADAWDTFAEAKQVLRIIAARARSALDGTPSEDTE